MDEYNQPEKLIARQKLITHAINALTEDRDKNVLVTDDHFKFISNHFYKLIEKYSKNHGSNTNLNKTVNLWNDLYSSTVKNIKASELKILYLSGSEPSNDLNIFLENGIKPYNIWAIEKETKQYNHAVKKLKETKSLIKVHKGSLKSFFEAFDETFDIVYFDACCPIISNNMNPLDVLKELFSNRRLNKLSSLITNFAEPGKDQYEEWSKLLACWFSVRYQNCPTSTHENNFSDINERFYHLNKYSSFVGDNLDDYYGEFIPYFISVFASEMIPSLKTITFPSIQNKLVGDDSKLKNLIDKLNNNQIKPSEDLGEILASIHHHLLTPETYPLLNWSKQTIALLDNKHPLVRFLTDGNRTMDEAITITSVLKNFGESRSGFNVSIKQVCSDEIFNLLSKLDFFDREQRLTCDVPQKNLLVELLFGQYSFPYISNAGSHLSLKYKAKETWMYSDVFVFDQCRYLYDLLPTFDLFEEFFHDIDNQIYVRCCFDGIWRNHYNLNTNLFSGSAIEGFYFEGTTMGELNERININNSFE